MARKQEEERRGVVLHLVNMALYDGTGFRTVVFLKGCSLRCLWCSTPQSQRGSLELGYQTKKCTGCGSCFTACPKEAIQLQENSTAVTTNFEKCDFCFACVSACLETARQQYGRYETCEQLQEEIEKDNVFYFHSGGGVTVSGGEPLLQADFVADLLIACKKSGIHTAMEASADVPWEAFEKILPFIDMLLIDLKIFDSNLHRQFTGRSNKQILSNIKRIDQSRFPVDLYIRMPLIPSINDGEENLRSTSQFCKNLKKFKELHILPYHRLGVDSYEYLNREYQLKNSQTPSMELVEKKADRLRGEGIRVKLGG